MRKSAIVFWILLLCGFFAASRVRAQQPGDQDFDFVSAPPFTVDTTVTAPGPGSPSGKGRPPRVGPNTQVNAPQLGFPNGLFGRSETTIAGTDDGHFLVSGFNDAQGFCGPPFGVPCTPQSPSGLSGFGFSTDGGQTWTDGGAPPALGTNIFTRGDPWMERGGFDNLTFFYANLAVDATTAADLGVSVHRGHFSGGVLNWEDVQTFNAPNAPNDLYDKEAIATSKDGSGGGYVSVTNFIQVCGVPTGGAGQIEVWRTHDGGVSWQGPSIVSADATTPNSGPGCGATQVLQQSSDPAVGPNGEVYVVWQFGPTFSAAGTSTNANIDFARSLDGGVTFSTPMSVASINSMRQDSPVGYNRDRLNDHPRIAVATTGPNRGRIYVTYYSALTPVTAGAVSLCPSPPLPAGSFCRAQQLVSSQVFVIHSDDQGATWSSPVAVAATPPATGLKRWWPVVTVEPGGNVDVIYYESQEVPVADNPFCTVNTGAVRRRGTANSLVDTFWARSTDGGATFAAPIQVTTATTNWCTTVSNIQPNFGDYIGSVSGGNHVFPVWADGRNGVPDVFYSQLLGSGKSP